MVDQVYRTAAAKVFVAENASALVAATNGMAFSASKEFLVNTDGKGGEVRKERLGAQPQASRPLVGAWRYRHYTGAVAFELYTSDGRFLFRLPMTSYAGCFHAEGGSLGIVTPELKPTMSYTVAAAQLLLRGEAGKAYAYRRAEPWYPRDQIDYQAPK